MPETYVLDCSIAAKWLLPEPGTEAALILLDRYQSGDIDLIAPDLLLTEFASLLAKRNRRRSISAEQARSALDWLTRFAPRLFETKPLLSRALDLSLQNQLSLWDCVYLTLARENNCPFLTADRRLMRAAAGAGISLTLLQ